MVLDGGGPEFLSALFDKYGVVAIDWEDQRMGTLHKYSRLNQTRLCAVRGQAAHAVAATDPADPVQE